MIFLNKELGRYHYPVIVAEISCNHQGSTDQGKKLIDAAKEAGADAVKIQVYTPDDMTIENYGSDFIVKEGEWAGRDLYGLYTKTKTDFNLADNLITYAKSIDMPWFASVFGTNGLNFLEAYNCPAYKIASFELTDTSLIRAVTKTAKPVVLSTGLADLNEIDQAMQCVNPHNAVLMHCVSAYPTKLEQANLWRIQNFASLFPCPIGYSDHTRGIMSGPLAVAMGARLIEKHLSLPGTNPEDDAFSLHPHEFEMYVQRCNLAAEAVFRVPVPEEEYSRQFRRSLYIVEDIKKGEFLTKLKVRAIRPGLGMPASELHRVIGKAIKRDTKAGTALTKDMLI